MSSETAHTFERFQWEPQPDAAELVGGQLAEFRRENPEIERFSRRLLEKTGSRLIDWVDALVYPTDTAWGPAKSDLTASGFRPTDDTESTWENQRGIFPRIVLGAPAMKDVRHALMFRVENVEDVCRRFPAPAKAVIEGAAGGQYRTVELSRQEDVSLVAVERHGWRSFDRPSNSAAQIQAAGRHLQAFVERQRRFDSNEDGFQHTVTLAHDAVAEVGVDWACDLFFDAERRYWMTRNRAARTQYALQQQLGLGWANHDHHTFRSSRTCFHRLIEVLETLGFHCRERFYAGEEAGWGAQVLEQSGAGYVVFADVDMSADEVTGDFAHQGLPERRELGTVGLWCQLHGESMLAAGLHHLECQFDFDAARDRLADEGIETMAPFTNFPFLRQAFTEGEVWPIDPQRIKAALAAGQITESQAQQFERDGTIGSHLEILERNDGYKGFNQTGVSDIIARTDPRRW